MGDSVSIVLKVVSLITLLLCLGAAIFHLVALIMYSQKVQDNAPAETYLALSFTTVASFLLALLSLYNVLRLLISSLRKYSRLNTVLLLLYMIMGGLALGCGMVECTITGIAYRLEKKLGLRDELVESLFASGIVVSGVAVISLLDSMVLPLIFGGKSATGSFGERMRLL
ncbi:hypothetical protein C9374_005291 [Naegleria lovaniensis]|uniref:Uncharacterized protein n=1 Tax=Naegleria lovaniensis TaxID=51637 RepID=A0AA88GKM0_NAELO|nr:uncharacterized protein C9374_005291 [Naegleria lovaniensis]KAG2382711.1 hypothetical protein C9374_005291 [Naegleria lovaniensis]